MKAGFVVWSIPSFAAELDDTLNLLQGSVVRNHQVSSAPLPDMDLVPGTDNYTVFFDFPPPNPKMVQNDGTNCFKGWGHIGQYRCSDEKMKNGTACTDSFHYAERMEHCCPGTCSNTTVMNPVKWVMESNRQEEVRCLARYQFSAGNPDNGFKPRKYVGDISVVHQTCDMIITGALGWFTENRRGDQLRMSPSKPNLKKLDGTWVYEQCWNSPLLQECCPTECANSQKTAEMAGALAVDKSLYRDPPDWKMPDDEYYMPAVGPYQKNRWFDFVAKGFEWKGDVCWYSTNEAYGVNTLGNPKYGGLDEFGSMPTQGNYKKNDNMALEPQHFWAGGIRCEDIPLLSSIGYREMKHSVDQDLNATDREHKQYAEVWSLCGNTRVAQCCPAICGFTTCGVADVGGAGSPPIECKAQKKFDLPSRKYVDLPREKWDGRYAHDDTSFMEVGPGTPTPAPGLQPGVSTPSPTSATTTPAVAVCPGTDNPDEGTGPTDGDCFDAENGFGAGFTCTNTDMFCGQDSGDGITVGMCCPDKCRKEFEKKNKNEKEDARKENQKKRRENRRENERKRKEAERERKKKRKDEEWNTKREQKEGENKKKEGERKDERNFAEGKRKKERTWKQNRREKSQKANQRERGRKEKRNKDKPGLEGQECFATKVNWGPLYYCRLAEDSCGGDDDATIVDCCPNACQTTATTTGPGQECFATDSSNWPGDWHCNQLPPVKNYCGCGDEVEAKVKECCPKMCIATDVCGGFAGIKPESPPNLEQERKKKRAAAEQLRKRHRSERKSKRSKAEKKRKDGNQTPTQHKCLKQLKTFRLCAKKKGCERGQKRKGNSEPTCA